MRKTNRHAEKIKQAKAAKRNRNRLANKQIRQERLNHRANVIEAKKEELFNRWVSEVVRQFEESHPKE